MEEIFSLSRYLFGTRLETVLTDNAMRKVTRRSRPVAQNFLLAGAFATRNGADSFVPEHNCRAYVGRKQ